jgi:osmoprotectant transport system substrate-binding protein
MKNTRSRLTRLAVVLAATSLVAAACGGDDGDGGTPAETTQGIVTIPEVTGSITVGSANFPENQLLAEIYGQALEAKGFTVQRRLNIGSREVYFAALVNGEIDLLPEYTNSLLSYTLRQTDPDARPTATNIDEQVAELMASLPDELTVLAASTAEDKDVIVCRSEIAEQYELATLGDLAAVAGEITLGAPPEFETRAPFGLVGFQEIYGAEFKEFVPLNIGGVADSLKGGAIDCGNLFSTMSVITTEGFVALDDEQTIVPNEAVIPVIRRDAVSEALVATLNAVSAALNTDNLKEMMVRVEVDAADPAVVAADFLAAQGLG